MSTYVFLLQSERIIQQQYQFEIHKPGMFQFGESHLDERTLTPEWLQGKGGNTQGGIRIDEFPLANGETFVKLIYANGRTICFEVPEEDPFEVFSMAVWKFSRCKG